MNELDQALTEIQVRLDRQDVILDAIIAAIGGDFRDRIERRLEREETEHAGDPDI